MCITSIKHNSSWTGTHWLWEITSMLRNEKAQYHGKEKTSAMLEFIPAEVLRSLPKPRIYNTHFTPQCLPKQVFNKKCKILFLQRNPKDVLVSLLSFLKGHTFIDSTIQWEEFISKYMELGKLKLWYFYSVINIDQNIWILWIAVLYALHNEQLYIWSISILKLCLTKTSSIKFSKSVIFVYKLYNVDRRGQTHIIYVSIHLTKHSLLRKRRAKIH